MIASYMAEFTDLDQVWFMISPQNPLKDKATLLPDVNRLYMVNVAVENERKFKASNIEFHLPKPSFTIDTLTYLGEKYPDKDFVLIAGSDILPTFHKWKNYEQILEHYHFYLYPRPQRSQSRLTIIPPLPDFRPHDGDLLKLHQEIDQRREKHAVLPPGEGLEVH